MRIAENLKQLPKTVIVMAIVAVVALLGLLVLRPMLTGSAEVDEPAAGAAAPGPLVEAGGPPRLTSSGDPASGIGPLPRDPFAPLVSPATLASSNSAAAPAAAGPPAAGAPGPAAPPLVAPAPAPVPVAPAPAAGGPAAPPPPPPPPPPPSDPAPAPPSTPPPTPPQPVKLIQVFVDVEGVLRAGVSVGQATYTPKAGESFDNHYRVLSIRDNCAVFERFGNSFNLCAGETLVR